MLLQCLIVVEFHHASRRVGLVVLVDSVEFRFRERIARMPAHASTLLRTASLGTVGLFVLKVQH
jgi:hypothetical protein